MATYLSDSSYLMIKPETTAGTPVIPTILIPLVSTTFGTNASHTADRRMRGIDWKSMDLLRGNRQHEGEIVVLCDPDSLGHILNMIMLKGSTTGSAPNGFTHPWTIGAPKSYTMEIKHGLYAQRFFGVYIDKVKFDFSEGNLQATLSVAAMGQFSIGTVGVALTGAAMTTLVLDDEYDISPSRGIVVNDVIGIELTAGGFVEVTVLTVNANGTTVTFASTSITAAVGKSVYLKPLTVTQPTLFDPFYFGNLLVGFGATASGSATNATQALSTPIYDLTIEFNQNLFRQNGSNRMDPVQIIPRTKEAQIELTRLFTDPLQRQAWQDRTKQAFTMIFLGKYIDTAMTIQEKLTLTFNKVKMIEDPNDITVGELITDKEKLEVLYDSGDAAAMSASLINRTAGTVY